MTLREFLKAHNIEPEVILEALLGRPAPRSKAFVEVRANAASIEVIITIPNWNEGA